MGEGHTNANDHSVQMSVIKYLREKGKEVVVAMEMFPVKKQPVLDKWIKGDLEEQLFEIAYYSSWTVDYRYYRDIFRYAADNNIRIVAINTDSSYIDFVSNHGIEMLNKKTRDLLKLGGCEDAQAYRKSMELIWNSMNHSGDFSRICDVRRFREAVMAYNISTLLKGGDYTLVVMVGAIHAIKIAVPSMLERHDEKVKCAIMLPSRLNRLTGMISGLEEADYTW